MLGRDIDVFARKVWRGNTPPSGNKVPEMNAKLFTEEYLITERVIIDHPTSFYWSLDENNIPTPPSHLQTDVFDMKACVWSQTM